MSLLDFFKPRCSQCRRPVQPGVSLNKHVKMADGSWKRVCGKCYKAMSSPGKLKNKHRRKHNAANRD